MTERAANERLDRGLAALLWYGTWAASALIGIGMGVEAVQRTFSSVGFGALGYAIVKSGVALLIALPALRVLVLFGVFLRRRDFTYALISGLVLTILGAGVVIGMRSYGT